MNVVKLMTKIDSRLKQRGIFCIDSWLSERINKISSKYDENYLYDHIMKEICENDIQTYIDKTLVSNEFKNVLDKNNKYSLYKGFLFTQIQDFTNISEPSMNKTMKDEEKSKVDLKFLSNEDDADEEETTKTNTRSLMRLLLSNGCEEVFGCEYEKLNVLESAVISKPNKVLIGPEFEVRRGYIYLRNSNFSLL